jgi:hypothetical protein
VKEFITSQIKVLDENSSFLPTCNKNQSYEIDLFGIYWSSYNCKGKAVPGIN